MVYFVDLTHDSGCQTFQDVYYEEEDLCTTNYRWENVTSAISESRSPLSPLLMEDFVHQVWLDRKWKSYNQRRVPNGFTWGRAKNLCHTVPVLLSPQRMSIFFNSFLRILFEKTHGNPNEKLMVPLKDLCTVHWYLIPSCWNDCNGLPRCHFLSDIDRMFVFYRLHPETFAKS